MKRTPDIVLEDRPLNEEKSPNYKSYSNRSSNGGYIGDGDAYIGQNVICQAYGKYQSGTILQIDESAENTMYLVGLLFGGECWVFEICEEPID